MDFVFAAETVSLLTVLIVLGIICALLFIFGRFR
jgi:hypothetical protein